MKAYISEHELFPCYGVSLNSDSYGEEIDAPEETIRKWQRISRLFHRMQSEIEQTARKYKYEQEEIRHLKECFAKINPSRTDKAYILQKLGWNQIDTSVWEKDGRQVRLHEAYNECKNEVENAKS